MTELYLRVSQTGACRQEHAVHLDAGYGSGLPRDQEFARGISAGKGSPSAHTAPSSKYSFFQIGTVFLRVSMIHRQASNATPRCAAATTISTLVSPISSRPRRWTIDTPRTAKRDRASTARESICFSA